MAKMPGSIVVGTDDKVDKYLLLANSHAGMSSLQIKLTPIRVLQQHSYHGADLRGLSLDPSFSGREKAFDIRQ